MAETPRDPKLDPYLLIAQEKVLDLAELIRTVGTFEDEEYLVELYPTTAAEVENGLTDIGLGRLAILGADDLESSAVAGTVELRAEYSKYQMFVNDMIKGKHPEAEVPIPVANQKSRSAFVGFVFPYTGIDKNNDNFTKEHHIVVAADSTNDPPSICSWLDVQVTGEGSDWSTITHNTVLMNTEQSLGFVELALKLYEKTVNRSA